MRFFVNSFSLAPPLVFGCDLYLRTAYSILHLLKGDLYERNLSCKWLCNAKIFVDL